MSCTIANYWNGKMSWFWPFKAHIYRYIDIDIDTGMDIDNANKIHLV